MAELVLDELVSSTRMTHKISCDKCHKHICDSVEYDDGWYNDPSKYQQKFYIHGHGWYVFNRQLCNACADEITNRLINMLEDFGFRDEDD